MHRRVLVALGAVVSALVLAAAPSAGRRPTFPVTVRAANGPVTIPRRPRRIVSLSPTGTEDLYAVGAGRQVVAVDRFSDYPGRAPRTRLSPFSPNVEAIAGLRPDLVVLGTDVTHAVALLRKLRIPTLLEPPAQTFGDAYAQIAQLGAATGHAAAAARLVSRMRRRIAALVASAPRRATPLSVYHELSPDRFSATSSTFIGTVYRLFGLRDIADAAPTRNAGFPQLSDEYIVAADPDLIVLADTTCCGQSARTVAARPGWEHVAAVENGAIVQVDDALAARWGPRIVDFVRAIARALRTIEAG